MPGNGYRSLLDNIGDVLNEAEQLQAAQKEMALHGTAKIKKDALESSLKKSILKISSLSPQINRLKEEYGIRQQQIMQEIKSVAPTQERRPTTSNVSPQIIVQNACQKPKAARQYLVPQKAYKNAGTSPVVRVSTHGCQTVDIDHQKPARGEDPSLMIAKFEHDNILFQEQIQEYKIKVCELSNANKKLQKQLTKSKGLTQNILDTNMALETDNNTLKSQNQRLTALMTELTDQNTQQSIQLQDQLAAIEEYKKIIQQQVDRELELEELLKEAQNDCERAKVPRQSIDIQTDPAIDSQPTEIAQPGYLVNSWLQPEGGDAQVQTEEETFNYEWKMTQTEQREIKFALVQTDETNLQLPTKNKKVQVSTAQEELEQRKVIIDEQSERIQKQQSLFDELEEKYNSLKRAQEKDREKISYYISEVDSQRELVGQLQQDNVNHANENEELVAKLAQAADVSEQMGQMIEKQMQEIELLKKEKQKLTARLQQFKNLISND